jgi:hypothetical protein
MWDREGRRTKGIPQPDAKSRKETRPRGIIWTNLDRLCHGQSLPPFGFDSALVSWLGTRWSID